MGHIGRRHVDKLRIEYRGSIDGVLVIALQWDTVAERGQYRVDTHLVAREIEEALCVGRDGGQEEDKGE